MLPHKSPVNSGVAAAPIETITTKATASPVCFSARRFSSALNTGGNTLIISFFSASTKTRIIFTPWS